MRIGLIAVSGTPIRDNGVVEIIGQSKSLQARLKAVSSLPSLGLLTVAAVIASHARANSIDDICIEYLQCPDPSRGDQLPGSFDLVGISTYSAQIQETYDLARRLKDAGTVVVIGGTHASVRPEEVIEQGFIPAIGEAELIWGNIISDARVGVMKERYGELGVLCDITKSPVPAFDLLDLGQFGRLPIQTSRGCPHRCEFCAASVLISPRYRQKSVEQVLKEIDYLTELWNRPFVEFVDDNALVDHRYWKALLQELKLRKIRWFAECDISIGGSDDLLKLMRASGCREVLIGLESPSATDIAGIELNNDWKRHSQICYRRNIANIQSHGIRVIGCFMLALDKQDTNAAEDILQFVDETGLFDVQLTLQTSFPGTPLNTRLKTSGRLRFPEDFSTCTLFDLNIEPMIMTAEDTVNQFRQLLSKLHQDEEVSLRRKRFNQELKKGRNEERARAN